MTRLYLAGKMRGLPLFNFPAFFSAALYLRNLGHEVINPAERDMAAGMNPSETNTSDEFDLGQAFVFDFSAIISARAIALLPGWETSEGCAAELVVAKFVDAQIFEVDPSAPNGLRPLVLPSPLISFESNGPEIVVPEPFEAPTLIEGRTHEQVRRDLGLPPASSLLDQARAEGLAPMPPGSRPEDVLAYTPPPPAPPADLTF